MQITCDLVPKVKVKSKKMYILVNASNPKLLDVANSIFAGACY